MLQLAREADVGEPRAQVRRREERHRLRKRVRRRLVSRTALPPRLTHRLAARLVSPGSRERPADARPRLASAPGREALTRNQAAFHGR